MVADIARTARLKPAIPYGLGVQAIPVAGRSTLGHSGRFLGSRAVIRWLPGRADRDRGPDQPEPDGPEPCSWPLLLKLAFTPPPSCVACPTPLSRAASGIRVTRETGTSACP